MKQPSLKINFAWAFVGNAFYALCNYLLLMILTKTASVETVGLWGVAQAVALPVATFFSLKLSTVNITDMHNEYQAGHYVAARLLASLISVLVAAVIGFVFYPFKTACVIAIMGVSYAAAEIRQYYTSNMQKYERLSLATLSQVAAGLLTLLLFGLLFWLTQNLMLAILGTIISRIFVLLTYDMPVSAKVASAHNPSFTGYAPLWDKTMVWKLLRRAAPLAVVGAVGIIFVNIPRLVMDKMLGREAVGYFTALSMLLTVYTMLHTALGNAALPRLSKYFAENIRAFVWLLVRLIGLNLSLGIAFVTILFFFGKPILTFLFTVDYAQHKDVLVMLAVSSCLLSIFGVSNWGLNATRQFGVQIPVYISTAVICGIASIWLIPRFGLMGGAYAFMASYVFGAFFCLVLIGRAVRKRARDAG